MRSIRPLSGVWSRITASSRSGSPSTPTSPSAAGPPTRPAATWTEEEAEYHGEHVDFAPIWSWPKPQQLPHPPVLVGGNGPKVLDRVLAYGDEWKPNRLDGFAERVQELQRRAEEAGRGRIPV